MRRIIHWTAKRAGAAITVTGVDNATKEVVKLVGVTLIKPAIINGRWTTVATLADGEAELSVGS
jgi:hypothetical protein